MARVAGQGRGWLGKGGCEWSGKATRVDGDCMRAAAWWLCKWPRIAG